MVEVVVRSSATVGEVQGLVPQDTIAGLELEVVDPLDRGEELFLADDPSGTDRAEGTPTVVGSEARRAISADRGTQVVLVLIVVASLTEVALDSVGQAVARDITTDETVIEGGYVPEDELLLARVVEVELVLCGFVSDEGIYGVVTEGLAPREDLVERPAEVVFIRIGDTADLRSIPVVGVSQRFVLGGRRLEAVGDGELEVLEEAILEVEVPRSEVREVFVAVEADSTSRVDTTSIGTATFGGLTVVVALATRDLGVIDEVPVFVVLEDRVDRRDLVDELEAVVGVAPLAWALSE